VTNQSSIQGKLAAALERFSASGDGVAGQGIGPRSVDTRLTGFLFAVPFVTLANVATTPATLALNGTTIAQIALACAFPLVALGLLSLFAGNKMRAILTVALAPVALLLVTLGQFNTFAVAVLLLAIMANEAFNRRFERSHLGLGSLLTFMIASVLMGASGTALLQMTAFTGLVPVVLAGLAYVFANHKVAPRDEGDVNIAPLEIASFFALETNLVAMEIDRNAHVRTISPNAYEVLQLDKIELSGMAFFDRVHIADKVVLLSELDAVSNDKAKSRFKIRMQSKTATPDNSVVWLEIACVAWNSAAGLLLLVDAKDQDASTHQAATSASNTSSLNVVSHELRTPLNAIIGFSDLMAKGLAGDIANERQREYIGLINQSGHHLLNLVNSILDLSKLENGTYELEAEEFAPEESAQFAIQMLAMQAQEKRIALMPLCGLDGFHGDKRVCQQILINLLSNAVKFTPENGQITLRVELDTDRLMISVEDTGVGMSQEELSKVGTPFYQASGGYHRLHEGAGLGLSLVRQMSALHGGAMEITSEQGKGTKVRVALAARHNQEQVVSYLKHKDADESVRVIQIDEERIYGPLRKTA
jgi:two-component system, cell cycle sensor histidine kinase DivJ